MELLFTRSISILLAVAFGHELAINCMRFARADSFLSRGGDLRARLVDKCCQLGREKAMQSSKFNCKLSAREALASISQSSDRVSQVLATAVDSLVARDQNLSDQCEMVLESCCLAHHRTRNCNSGKQFAKGGSACMDVELSKEVTVATESFNDCCMSCSLGILAARTRAQNETSTRLSSALNDRCKLISPLASSLSGQLYEQTYIECCQENLPRPASPLNFNPDTKIDCSQAANVCSQRCLPMGSQDPATGRTIEQDRCDCFSGYKLDSDGVSCVDIDECKSNLHTCNRQFEICDNTRGSFRCLARAHQQHAQQPQSHSLLFGDQSGDPDGLSLLAEQAFTANRLCLPGYRWSTTENRCIISSNENTNQHQWKRNAAYSSSSVSSSRRGSRIE